MKANILEWLKRAHDEGFAIPAFDFSTMWDALACLKAAEEEKSPVIIMAVEPIVDSIGGYERAGKIGRALVDFATIPAFFHLDHGSKFENCVAAVDAGFDSVMIDGSLKSLADNIAETKRVVDYAHAKGVYVEAEIGKIKGETIESRYDGGEYLAETQDAVDLATATGIDMLAVGIGTQHGFYIAPPNLNFERLEEINNALGIPLVMHGGTGVSADDVQTSIKGGMSKINVGHDIFTSYSNTMKEILVVKGHNSTIMDGNIESMAAVTETARRWIRVCMSNGKA